MKKRDCDCAEGKQKKLAIVDSYVNDFHRTSGSVVCTDAHAVGGGTGDHQDGPYKIENNFLEASGESIMFGGGEATVTPSDIVVRRNHFFKPIEWMKGQPGFIGGVSGHPFIVKNHLVELKNAVRVLIEADRSQPDGEFLGRLHANRTRYSADSERPTRD